MAVVWLDDDRAVVLDDEGRLVGQAVSVDDRRGDASRWLVQGYTWSNGFSAGVVVPRQSIDGAAHLRQCFDLRVFTLSGTAPGDATLTDVTAAVGVAVHRWVYHRPGPFVVSVAPWVVFPDQCAVVRVTDANGAYEEWVAQRGTNGWWDVTEGPETSGGTLDQYTA